MYDFLELSFAAWRRGRGQALREAVEAVSSEPTLEAARERLERMLRVHIRLHEDSADSAD